MNGENQAKVAEIRFKRRRRGRRSSRRDRLAALASGFVGALALGASIYNVYLQRLQVRAQVWPHLEWSEADADGFTLNLANTVVGPALVKGIRLTVDGKPVKDWEEAWAALNGDADFAASPFFKRKDGQTLHTTMAHRVLGAGVEIHPIQLNSTSEDRPMIGALYRRIRVEICYCSTLEECWITGGFESTAVPSCPKTPVPFED
jgi:hypothetical protein